MASAIKPIRAKRRLLSSPWLYVSVLLHGAALSGLLFFVDTRSFGRAGLGSSNEDPFSVTWISGDGGGKGQEADTKVPGAGGEMLATAELVQPKAALIAIPENDPQQVFNSEPEDSPRFEVEESAAPTPSQTPDEQRRLAANSVSSRRESAPDLNASGEPSDSTDDPDGGGRQGTGEKGSGGRSAGGGGNQVSFFGIAATAKRVVFVIDASESMGHNRAMEIARKELLASLKSLESTAYFQIVFFDLKTHSMNRPGERPKLLKATRSNVAMAENFMKGIEPNAGTDRFLAVTQALSFVPDVIYLLTDADAPEMSAEDLWKIEQANKRHAAIHVVEFGLGADLGQDSFLKRLARKNRGTHFYRNLTKSGR